MKASVKIYSNLRFTRSWPPGRLLATLTIVLALAATSCSLPAVAGLGLSSGVANRSATTIPQAAPTPPATPQPTPVPTPAPTATPSLDLQRVKPNELGTIPILEYHLIEDKDGRWARSYDSFRQDLQKLYEGGYRPISLGDLLDNRIDLPAGASPVVFTFDDSSPGQFRFLEKEGQVVVDPNSAVGILEAFHASHPDFPLKGTFFVLPAADQPHRLFGQPQYESQKLRHLVERGFEIGNHTYWHQRLDTVDDREVQRQLGMAVKVIQQVVSGYRVRALALPLGMWPKNRGLALEGSFDGTPYHHEAILLVGSDPAPSPNSRDYDPLALPRVQVFDDSLDRWLAYLAKHPEERYVSDGDPNTITFPRPLESQLNPASVENRSVRGY